MRSLAGIGAWVVTVLWGPPSQLGAQSPVDPVEGLVPVVALPGGTFTMGNTGSAPGPGHEGPVHEVRVAPFAIGIHEVTQAQFETVMGYNPSLNQDPAHPVERVSWYDAVRFTNALSVREGYEPAYLIDPFLGYRVDPEAEGYRLPTEEEWEYAARAGTTEDSYAGPIPEDGSVGLLEEIGWVSDGTVSDATMPVGLKRPNPWGLYDVIGNVFEWTDAPFAPYPGGRIDSSAPGAEEAPSLRVLRGGAMDTPPASSRSAYRYALHPSYTSHNIGFRVVRSLR